ncbi:MAG: hypothetical protein WCG50_10005 [Rhodoferax sp.]|uniref:hypothetical protein n=1 Tax=Rhodoferax sp. TaxID=50421 RepID=UPI0030158D23
MSSPVYRIESNHPIVGPLLPYLHTAKSIVITVRELAVAMASKSSTEPCGHEIRVVHLPSGEVIFRKTDAYSPGFARNF